LTVIASVQNLTRSYGNVRGLRAVSFELHTGEIVGLLGLNGAGKSTALSLMTGRLTPDSGRIELFGGSLDAGNHELKHRFGFLPEGAPLFEDLSVRAQLATVSGLKGLKGSGRKSAIESVLKRFELTDMKARVIETLSKGYRRRVALACAFLGDPPLLLLDEPTDGLDPLQKDRVLAQLVKAKDHQTLLISTHSLEDVEAICDRVIVLHQGEVVFDGPTGELKSRSESLGQSFRDLLGVETQTA